MSANTEARDALISHDVRRQRALGGHQRALDEHQRSIERRIRALLEEVDIPGARTEAQRQRRLAKFEKRAREIAQEGYSEHLKQQRAYLINIGLAESQAVTGAIEASA